MRRATNKYYRPDIDGLRAIAVVSVLLFHAKAPYVTGGYVGVDVFFVISGYLITSIILRELKSGSFSMIKFWERRVRRIIPALFVMSLSTAVAGYFLFLYPLDSENLGKSLVALPLFLSNLFFMRRDTYFDTEVDTYPLLHTWSLAVEEQFYLFFPILLWFLWRFSKSKMRTVVGLLGVVSFGLSVYLLHFVPGNFFSAPLVPHSFWGGASNATAAFYLLPTRVWELIAGAALTNVAGVQLQRWQAELTSLLGIFLVLSSMVLLDATSSVPGLAAVLPVGGVILVIFAHHNTKTIGSKFLSWQPLVWVGLISYSLYLWHWPLLVFARTVYGTLNLFQTVSILLASGYVAWLSYKYIEMPFLQRTRCSSRLGMFLCGASMLVVLAISGYLLLRLDTQARVPEQLASIPMAENSLGSTYWRCFRSYGLPALLREGPCVLGVRKDQVIPDFALWGNSHAGAIATTIDELATAHGAYGVSLIEAGCAPVRGVEYPVAAPNCDTFSQYSLDYLTDVSIARVLIVANWYGYVGGRGEPGYIKLPTQTEFTLANAQLALESQMRNVIEQLSLQPDREIYILLQPPQHDNYNPRTLFYQSIYSNKLANDVILTRGDHEEAQVFVRSMLYRLADDFPAAHVLDPTEEFCSNGTCELIDDVVLYRDFEHVNYFGANRMTPLLEPFIISSVE